VEGCRGGLWGGGGGGGGWSGAAIAIVSNAVCLVEKPKSFHI